MKDTFEVNNDKARIAQLENDNAELLKQVEVMKRYITNIGKALTEREGKQANTFLDPYNEYYINDILKSIRDI
jgi:hypothetical protein